MAGPVTKPTRPHTRSMTRLANALTSAQSAGLPSAHAPATSAVQQISPLQQPRPVSKRHGKAAGQPAATAAGKAADAAAGKGGVTKRKRAHEEAIPLPDQPRKRPNVRQADSFLALPTAPADLHSQRMPQNARGQEKRLTTWLLSQARDSSLAKTPLLLAWRLAGPPDRLSK